MSKSRRNLSFVLIVSLIVTMLNGIIVPDANAAGPIHMNLTVEKDSNLEDKITETTVTLKWDKVQGAVSYEIWRNDVGKLFDVQTEVYTITELDPDTIYHFTVEAKDSVGAAILTDQKEINVITATTFTGTYIPEAGISDKESGIKPALKLQWHIPRYWDGTDFIEVPANEVDYRVTIGTDKAASNAGIYEINYDGSQYKLYKQAVDANLQTVLKSVYTPTIDTTNGILTYEWWRINPVNGDINDETLKSGTIYYMRLLPRFNNSENPFNMPFDVLNGEIKDKISTLKDGYVYTPLHIKIGKDANNNVTCTIDRINYDSENGLNIINFRYAIYSSSDAGFTSPVLEGYEYQQYGNPKLPIEVFIPSKSSTSIYYYKVLATSDAMDIIKSQTAEYTMATDPGTPIIPQNLTVDKKEVVSTLISGNTANSFNVTLKWDKPSDFDNYALEYHFFLSSRQTPQTISEGVYSKEEIDGAYYDIKYREVKIADGTSPNIDLSESGHVKYTLKGLELFTIDGGANAGQLMVNDDNYPAKLYIDKTYYLKIFAKRITSQAFSDYSIPVSITETIKNPPVIEYFNAKNVTDNEIGLSWKKSSINIQDYDVQQGSTNSLSYEIYLVKKAENGKYIEPYTLIDSISEPGTVTNERTVTYTSLLGDNIKSNMPYYFVIRSKLNISSEADPRYSGFSQILSVTTKKGSVVPPSDNEKIVRVPEDFTVDVDSDGNKKINVNSVTFKWTWLQEDINYKLIRTSKPIKSEDNTSKIMADEGSNYRGYILPNDSDIILTSVGQSVYTITVNGLEPNKLYYFSMRAERGDKFSQWITIPVNTGMLAAPDMFELVKYDASDKYWKLKIKWKGKDSFNYQAFVRAEGSEQYKLAGMTVISEEIFQGTSYKIYYATINGLISNTKYYIKLRAIDKNNSAITSNLIGPIVGRTEFSNADYQEEQNKQEQSEIFDERAQELKDGLYLTLTNTDSETRIKLRGAKVIEEMMHDNSDRLTIDISGLKKNSTRKAIIVPLNVINFVNSGHELLIVKAKSGEMVIKPMMIDDLVHPDILTIKNNIGEQTSPVKKEDYIFLKINIQKIDDKSSGTTIPSGSSLASEITDFSIEVIRSSYTEDSLEASANEKYSSILDNKLTALKNRTQSEKDTPAELDQLINGYLAEAKDELASYMYDRINVSSSSYIQTISELTNPIQFIYPLNTVVQGQGIAYHYRDSKWNEIATLIDNVNRTAVFEIKKPGKVAVFGKNALLEKNNNVAAEIKELDLKYGISHIVVENGVFKGEDPITFKRMMLVTESIIGKENQNGNYDVVKWGGEKLGLNSKLKLLADSHKLTKEETADIVLKLYSLKTGTSVENFKPSKPIYLKDAQNIDKTYYKTVIMAVDLKLIAPDSTGRISASVTLTQKDALIMLNKVLTLAGEL